MRRSLLFISKYPDIIREFLDAMRDKEIEIDTALNGIDAAALLKKKEYQIVVSGLVLDGYNGEQIITYINKTYPNTICIIYTTTISAAQFQFFTNKRDVFRIFLRPVNFRMEFFQALEEAFEYYEIRVRTSEKEEEMRQKFQKYRSSVVELERKLEHQKNAKKRIDGYMKRLAGDSLKEYAGRLAPEGRNQLLKLETEVIDLCCMLDGNLAGNLEKAETAVRRIGELAESR